MVEAVVREGGVEVGAVLAGLHEHRLRRDADLGEHRHHVVRERLAVAVAALVDVLGVVGPPAAQAQLDADVARALLEVAVEAARLLAVGPGALHDAVHLGAGVLGQPLAALGEAAVPRAEGLPGVQAAGGAADLEAVGAEADLGRLLPPGRAEGLGLERGPVLDAPAVALAPARGRHRERVHVAHARADRRPLGHDERERGPLHGEPLALRAPRGPAQHAAVLHLVGPLHGERVAIAVELGVADAEVLVDRPDDLVVGVAGAEFADDAAAGVADDALEADEALEAAVGHHHQPGGLAALGSERGHGLAHARGRPPGRGHVVLHLVGTDHGRRPAREGEGLWRERQRRVVLREDGGGNEEKRQGEARAPESAAHSRSAPASPEAAGAPASASAAAPGSSGSTGAAAAAGVPVSTSASASAATISS